MIFGSALEAWSNPPAANHRPLQRTSLAAIHYVPAVLATNEVRTSTSSQASCQRPSEMTAPLPFQTLTLSGSCSSPTTASGPFVPVGADVAQVTGLLLSGCAVLTSLRMSELLACKPEVTGFASCAQSGFGKSAPSGAPYAR